MLIGRDNAGYSEKFYFENKGFIRQRRSAMEAIKMMREGKDFDEIFPIVAVIKAVSRREHKFDSGAVR